MPVCLIGLGSNQGDRQATLEAAVAELGRQSQFTIVAVSAWRETAPIGGAPGQERFLNGALRGETSLSPHELLAGLQQIEDRLGRRRAERWASRTLDLDLLLYDELVLDTPEVILPHPRMAWRRFVLEPAAEVAGAMLHPTIRWTIAVLLAHLNSAPPYVAITGPIAAGKTLLAQRLADAVPARLIVEQPDWPQLDAFYTDPASCGWQTELKFLHQRARLLSSRHTPCADILPTPAVKGDSPHLCEAPSGPFRRAPTGGWSGTVPFFRRWTVSDFWFDQSAAFARAWLSPQQLPAFLEQYEQLRQDVVRPKLIVLLDSPPEALLARVHRRGRECEQRLTVEQLARIRREVRAQADWPDLGPVLRAAGDLDTVFAEVLAAVQAME